MRFEDSPKYRMGDASQTRWCRHLAATGMCAMPAYGATGNTAVTKAPALYTVTGTVVLPDVLVLSPGHKSWHEVKAKTDPTWRRLPPGPRWEHGIDLALVPHYTECEERTGIPVWIVVHEINSPADPGQDSPLTGPEIWLGITLRTAVASGQARATWPGGAARPQERGRDGKGGWLWARSQMSRLRGPR